MPAWLLREAGAQKPRAIIKPSDAEVEPTHARSGDSETRRKARQRGNLLHRLMQSLPDIPIERRAEAARRFLARGSRKLSETERDAIAAQALGVLGDARFAPLFAPGSRAELPIVGMIGDKMVAGQVDRLAVTQEAVLIADYKTNARVPRSVKEAEEFYPGYIRQLALYRAVLMRLYPGRPVHAALIWTERPELMEIPADSLDSARAAALAMSPA